MKNVELKLNFLRLFISYLSCSFFTSVAQNINYISNAPVPGDSLTFQKADYADPGPSGIGQVWNFSQLIPNGVPIIKKYFNPGNLPTSIYNPISKCNLAYGATNYLICDSTGLYDLGQGGRLYKYYLPDTTTPGSVRDLILKFPFQINDSIRSYSSYFSGSYGDLYSEGTKTYLFADATGTLITPCGTYTNTIRIHRLTEYSSLYTKASSSSSTGYLETNSYEWYARGIHGAILSLYSSRSYSWWTPSVYNKWSIVFNDLQKNPLGIYSNRPLEFQDFYFENPSFDELNLEITESGNSNYTLQIIDFSGKELLDDTFSEKSHSIDLSSISAGIYILQIKKENGSYGRKKLVIEK